MLEEPMSLLKWYEVVLSVVDCEHNIKCVL